MKAWLRNNKVEYNNDKPRDAGKLICERDFADAELRWPKLNAAGTDIGVDLVAKAAWEAVQKSVIIDNHTKDDGLIDQKTKQLLDIGLPHPTDPNVKFSMSITAQMSMTALDLKKDVLTYPFYLSKIGGEAVALTKLELTEIANSMLTRVVSVKKAGNDLKTWMRDPARTYAELSTFVDGRT